MAEQQKQLSDHTEQLFRQTRVGKVVLGRTLVSQKAMVNAIVDTDRNFVTDDVSAVKIIKKANHDIEMG